MSSSPAGEATAGEISAGSPGSYEALIAWLGQHEARFRVLEHAPEGRTELVSRLRGHPVEQAAKCMVIMVKLGKKTTRHVLAVVEGDARVDFAALKQVLGGTYAGFASGETAERLTGTISGTILPFTFNQHLELIVDPGVLSRQELFFNAARLDRSLALDSRDYHDLAQPRVATIATRSA